MPEGETHGEPRRCSRSRRIHESVTKQKIQQHRDTLEA